MKPNEFLNLSREDFETYIKDIYPQSWTEDFQLALLAQKDDDLVRLFHYSFPNKFCERAKNVFFETFGLDIVKEISAFTVFPENTYGATVLTYDEYSKLDLKLHERHENNTMKVESCGKKFELTMEDYSLRGGFFRLRENFPDIAKKLYNGSYEGNLRYMFVINHGTGYIAGFYL